jgi:hypothetical protein
MANRATLAGSGTGIRDPRVLAGEIRHGGRVAFRRRSRGFPTTIANYKMLAPTTADRAPRIHSTLAMSGGGDHRRHESAHAKLGVTDSRSLRSNLKRKLNGAQSSQPAINSRHHATVGSSL